MQTWSIFPIFSQYNILCLGTAVLKALVIFFPESGMMLLSVFLDENDI